MEEQAAEDALERGHGGTRRVMSTRKYGTIDGRGVISVEEGPTPEPSDGEVLIEVEASAISPGTELGGVKARRRDPDPSASKRPFGYQNAGRLIEKGKGCEEFEDGERLACMGSGYALHATHACVPENLCVPIPEGVSYEEAAFNHLAATALNAIRRADVRIGENVVVMGLGLVGQLCCQLAEIAGAHVMGVDRLEGRVAIAAEVGVDKVVNVGEEDPVTRAEEFTRGYGMDCGIIAFGGEATKAFRQVVEMLKEAPDTHKMGRVVIVGGATITHGFAAALGNVDVRSAARTGPGYHDAAYERGRDYPRVFVEWTTGRNLEETVRWMAEGTLDVASLITHRYPLEEIDRACELLIERPNEALGVVLRPKSRRGRGSREA